MKKIKPTPKSITHKNPMKISASFNKEYNPKRIKYKPALYKSTITLLLVTKYNVINIINNSKIK